MRNSVSIYSMCLIFLTINVVSACSIQKENDPQPDSYPIADGTFIQDYLVAKWDDDRWQSEFAVLKEAGMHYIIFAPTLQTDESGINRTIYPGGLPNASEKYTSDLVDACLRNAKRAGLKVFLGLNFNDKWWSPNYTAEWLYSQMELGNLLADDLVKRYKGQYSDTMYGWYWVWEVDNLNYTTKTRRDMLIRALNLNIDHLNKITPEMPFMFCPFVNYRVGNSGENRDMWQYVFSGTHFRQGDIFAPQDCVGAGGLELGMVDEWFRQMSEAVKTKSGLEFWSDAETFDYRFWTSASIDRFIEQMKIEKPYVSNIVSFAYTHYYSPFQITKNFHKAYLEYVKTGSLTLDVKPEPVDNLMVYSDLGGKLILSWKEPENTEGLAGYLIFKGDILIGNIQYKSDHQFITGFDDPNSTSTNACYYEVCSYSCKGLKSERKRVDWKK